MPNNGNPISKGFKVLKVVIISTSAVIAESLKKLFIRRGPDDKKLTPAHKRRGFNKPRVYKLRGYTTTSRVDKKVRAEQNQRLLRNFLVAAVFVLIIAILLIIFNPLKDIRELFRMIGI